MKLLNSLKYLFYLLIFFLISCKPVKDIAESPSSVGQNRVLIESNGDLSLGIYGAITDDTEFKVRVYREGSVSIRGLDVCGLYTSKSVKNSNYVTFNTKDLLNFSTCVYAITSKTKDFDHPQTGYLIMKNYDNPNVRSAFIRVGDRIREGINWTQVRKDITTKGLIKEDRFVSILPNGSSGKIIITGCDITPLVYEFNESEWWETSIDNLYKELGPVDKDCVFQFFINNDDALKQEATFLVDVYDGGSFLDAPAIYRQDDDICFEFIDKYVTGIRINNKFSQHWNTRKMCVLDNKKSYEVEGVTSSGRIFYGIYQDNDWKVMK